MKYRIIIFIFILTLFSCDNTDTPLPYTISGQVMNQFGKGMEGIKIYYTSSDYAVTDEQGNWFISGLTAINTITPIYTNYTFLPSEIQVSETTEGILFTANSILSVKEKQVINWFNGQQLSNGLLESAENSNSVSLYDNALSAMVFMLNSDFERAERIFDFFDARIHTEFLVEPGGFSQHRDRNGVPNNHRWMGDNAWLLIALNNYKVLTGNNRYDVLATEIKNWLISLQDTDGGLFGGFNSDNSQINKITEGNIDAFNAVSGYTTFHSNLLDFLENDRWNASEKNLIAWVGHPSYQYALDLHSWSYCIFEDYPVLALTNADYFLNTQTATTTGEQVTGYCFDIDKDAVWLEGTGQMALAFVEAGLQAEANFYLGEMEKVLIASSTYNDAFGFPYATNQGTGYGNGQLWQGADTNPVISSGAWYLFARTGFNPFSVERNKHIPEVDKFWLD